MAMSGRYEIQGRIQKLQRIMKEMGIQWYYVPTGDFHDSEYVNDYFKGREYLSGFTGSNGTLLVSMKSVGLWTDGRYFIQAQMELADTGITLFRMMEEGVPTLQEYLKEHVKSGDTLGFDGRVVPATVGKRLEVILSEKDGQVVYEQDLIDLVWTDRPGLSREKILVLKEEISGESTEKKLKRVREKMEEVNADCFVLSKLDDIMWLYNVRGGDISCNPVALSYTVIEKDKATIFLQRTCYGEEELSYFQSRGIAVAEYDTFYQWIDKKLKEKQILLDMKHINYACYMSVSNKNRIINKENPTEAMKAVKNPIEIENLKKIYLQDSAAVTKFIYWVKKTVQEKEITEYDAAMYLDQLRKEIPGYMDLSFETISAYMKNAAMMHYTATKECASILKPEGTLLVDSGGQYMGGTTDVTRTIGLGSISSKERLHYTYTCIGMFQLLSARFLYGCTGRNLDILAREPLWRIDTDYKCGTGHGIGYMLNVHEGPQNIRWRYSEHSDDVVFEEGMIVSNEPGVYLENEYGIRIENIMVCKKGNKNENGQFMYFEPLTFVPIERDALDTHIMSKADVERVNQYHKKVYEVLQPYLTREESIWLKETTKPL